MVSFTEITLSGPSVQLAHYFVINLVQFIIKQNFLRVVHPRNYAPVVLSDFSVRVQNSTRVYASCTYVLGAFHPQPCSLLRKVLPIEWDESTPDCQLQSVVTSMRVTSGIKLVLTRVRALGH